MDRDTIAEYHPELLVLEPEAFDAAIVGVAEGADGRTAVIYDSRRCIDILQALNGWPRAAAIEWFYANTACAGPGEYAPMFLSTELG
jgi:hypothetical protein